MNRPENSEDSKPAQGKASQDDSFAEKASENQEPPEELGGEEGAAESSESVLPEDLQKKTLKSLSEQIEDLKRQNLRLLADYENLKKRAAKEFLQASTVGAERVVKKLLPVLDSFESALRHLSD